MKIWTATYHDSSCIKNLFPKHDVSVFDRNLLGERWECDLLIFMGGDDVNSARYGHVPPSGAKFDNKRDEFEMNLIREVRLRRGLPKRTMGICRGMQLLNVAFGGGLLYDIFEGRGKSHNAIHKLSWKMNSPLSTIFPEVNSLHHQCIERLSDSMYTRILAVEPSTGTPEVCVWEPTYKYLGLQFHPEYMLRHPNIGQFVKFIEDWVAGEITPVSEGTPPTDTKLKKITYNW